MKPRRSSPAARRKQSFQPLATRRSEQWPLPNMTVTIELRALEAFSKGDFLTVNADGTAHRMEEECRRWLGRAWMATLACDCPKGACTCDRSVPETTCTHVHAIAAEDVEQGKTVKAVAQGVVTT